MLTVGEILRKRREERGLSVKEVVDDTYIQAKFIIALECNDYSVFPAEVYAKGFLRNYSELLGLDAQEMLELFNRTKSNAVPTHDQKCYKNVTSFEPEVQRVADIEGRKATIEEAIAAEYNPNEDLTGDTVKIETTKHRQESIDIEEQTKELDVVASTKVDIPKAELEAEGTQDEAPDSLATDTKDALQELPEEPIEKQDAIYKAAQIDYIEPLADTVEPKQHTSELNENTSVREDKADEEHQSSFRQKLAENRSSGSSGKKVLIIVAVLIAVAAAGYSMLFTKGSNDGDTEQKPNTLNIFKQNTSLPKAQVTSMELTGKVNARCWVSIVADGKTIFEDNLQPGSTFKWPAKESLKVTIGNVNALSDLKINNKPADLGQVRNNVVEKTFLLKDVQ